MGRTRESANLVSDKNIFVDIANDFVGIGTTAPTVALEVSGNAKVSGIVTATTFSGSLSGGTLSATTGAFSGDVTLTDTDTGSSAGPELKLYRNSSSPADADYLGQIKFAGESDTGAERNYAKITGKISDASNGTEDGIIEIAHIKAGSQNISARWTSTELHLLNGTELSLDDDQKIYLGTGDDFQIYHDGTSNIFLSDGTADFKIQDANHTSAIFDTSAEVQLYYDNSKKLETKSDGIDVTGEVQCDSLDVDGIADISSDVVIGGEVNLMGSSDSSKFIDVRLGSGTLNIRGTSGGDANHETMAQFTRNGAVSLYYDNSKKFETTGGGVTITGIATATSFSGDGSSLTNVPTGFSPINFVLS